MKPSEIDRIMVGRLEQFDRLVGECRALYEERNRGYGDSVRTLGVLGVLYEFNGIAGRLRTLRHTLARAEYSEVMPLQRASVRDLIKDKLKDVVNYGLIALMLLEDENILGEE